MKTYLIVFFFAIASSLSAQVVVSDGTPATIHDSAVFELQSTSKGFLAPKMTTAEREAISPLTAGLLVFDITLNKFYVYSGTAWVTSASNWLGSTSRIKLLPNDFVGTLGGGKGDKTTLSLYDDDADDDSYSMTTSENSSYLVAFVALPTGYKATSVKIYGTSTSESFYVFEGDITTTSNLEVSGNDDYLGSATITTSGGTVTFASAISSTDTNYLIVAVSFETTKTDQLYGGYVTILPE